MDFFEHQERARRKTGLLVVYFFVAVALIILSVYLAVAGILFYGHDDYGRADTLWFPDVFATVSSLLSSTVEAAEPLPPATASYATP